MNITTRAQARLVGSLRYFSGRPCAHGHLAERYTKSTNCVECQQKHNRNMVITGYKSPLRATPENREKARVHSANYHAANREDALAKMKVRNKAYYQKNKERIKAQTAEYQAANGPARNAYKSKWMTERAKTDPEFAALLTMRKFVARMLDRVKAKRVQSARTTEIVGYTPAEFVAHIEPMFKPGMTWENHGEWHIDHMRPLSTFDLTDPAQQKMANSLHNLQPMWALPNMKKSDKWSGQASLI